jgi:hypothetical protein
MALSAIKTLDPPPPNRGGFLLPPAYGSADLRQWSPNQSNPVSFIDTRVCFSFQNVAHGEFDAELVSPFRKRQDHLDFKK